MQVYKKFEGSALIAGKKTVIDFYAKEEKWTNKGNDKKRVLILCYKIQQVKHEVCTNFQNSRLCSSWEIISLIYIWVTVGKRKKWKKKANKSYTIEFNIL